MIAVAFSWGLSIQIICFLLLDIGAQHVMETTNVVKSADAFFFVGTLAIDSATHQKNVRHATRHALPDAIIRAVRSSATSP